MKKKYLVIPGEVMSRNDGDIHYISAEKLMDLYKVDRRECIIARPGERLLGYTPAQLDTLKRLTPRFDGKYKV